jgi:hypothetical protein
LAPGLSGEPYTAEGFIDGKPKMTPPLQYQWMFKEDEAKHQHKGCVKKLIMLNMPRKRQTT